MNKYYSQAGQDKWVAEMTGWKENGYFIDLGAGDGEASSNTLFLEEHLNWHGVCIEPSPPLFKALTARRNNTINANCAISDYAGNCFFGHDRISENENDLTVSCATLVNLLDMVKAPQEVDYLSIDIEGQEIPVLTKFFEENIQYRISLITVEHNLYHAGTRIKDQLFELLSDNGYDRIVEDAKVNESDPIYGGLPFEDWYKLR